MPAIGLPELVVILVPLSIIVGLIAIGFYVSRRK